jgi:hypothetical protein
MDAAGFRRLLIERKAALLKQRQAIDGALEQLDWTLEQLDGRDIKDPAPGDREGLTGVRDGESG